MSERVLHIPNRIREAVRESDWYNRIGWFRGELMLGSLAVRNAADVAEANGSPRDRAARLLLRVFTQLLGEGAITLGEAGPNWDAQRQVIDTVVVHHTAGAAPANLGRLNAMHLLNLYVPKYQSPGEDFELIGGTPIYSGHADAAGNQVFYGYHWLIREDGSREHLLPDERIGWHAGNWEVNTRSVAVCFDGDLGQGLPTSEALDSAVELIATVYGHVASARILGHNAIVQTTCPGGEFTMWGEELRALVDANRATS